MPLKGRGKSGGARVIYYFQVSEDTIIFIEAFLKNEKSNLTGDEKKSISALIKEIKS